jgi:hypothetical protein
MTKYDTYKRYPTEPGWYCIGWERLDKDEQGRFGPDMGDILYFDGSQWNTEFGEEVDSLFDAVLQDRVAMDAADYYVRQN